MKARTRPILVLAVTTALVIPLSMAQIAAPKGKAIGQTAAQVPPPSPPPARPLSASTAAAEALLNTNAPPSPQTLNETEPRPPPEVEQAAMNPPQRPAQSQGAVNNAASRSALAPRGIWAQLDVNGDGRISGSEGQVDADFKANFEMMDANRDGFITAGEYRAQAQSDQPEPEEERDD